LPRAPGGGSQNGPLIAYRLARRAEADSDDIAEYIATVSGSLNSASRVIEALTARFIFPADNPFAGQARDDDVGPGRLCT
jgi:plasmid stabilization system protein ParE